MRGFTIFYATLITGLALAIGLAIYDLTVRELQLSATANQSQQAIYAADAGAECALYWDTNCTASSCRIGSAFATSTWGGAAQNAGLNCQGQDITSSGSNWTVTQNAATQAATTSIQLSGGAVCATVVVAKWGAPTHTTITSYGQYNCSGTVGQVQRALQVNY
jgi:hypothetical protein